MQSTESFYTTRLINENYHFTVKHITSNIFRIGIRKTDGEFVYLMNEGPISRKFGVTTEIVYNKSVKEIYGLEMDSIIKPYFIKAFNGEVCNYEMNFGDVIFETILSPVEKNGEIIEIAGSSIDITEKKKYQKKIEEMNLELKKAIMTDSLTKLYNRRKFDEILSEQLSLANKQRVPFVIIIGDIDNFKRINDEFGHLTGDKVLIELSNLLKQNIPTSGFLARWGGEEFSILLQETNIQDSQKFIELLLKKINKNNFTNSIKLTMSFGISSYKEHDDILTIINRADKALYKSKNNGKNTFYIG